MNRLPARIDLAWLRRARGRILRWYDQHGRSLPWRESQDPYRIWISEIMLQQTTVAAVLPYFERFLVHFPNVSALAAADQDAVMKQWEGLGYYSRARNLHKAAQCLVDDFDRQFPQTAEELEQLPGIGPYTAAAIASFAFNQPAGIVEANTLRLYSRLMGLREDPRSATGQKLLWKFANRLVARRRAGDFNQAVMDIGAQVCTPTDPQCVDCPLMASCAAYEDGSQHQIPVPKTKTEFTPVNEVSLAIFQDQQVLLKQYQPGERWAGLWDFVRFEVQADTLQQLGVSEASKRSRSKKRQTTTLFQEPQLPVSAEIQTQLMNLTGLEIDGLEFQTEIRHTVTRFRIRLLCLTADQIRGSLSTASDFVWTDRNQLSELPLSTTGRKFADQLQG